MPSDKNSIRSWEFRNIRLEEVAHVDVDTRSTKATGILINDGFAFWADFKCVYCQMRKLQTSLYRYTPCTKAYIPKNMSLGKIEGLQRQQTNGHLGNHLLTTVEQHEGGVRNEHELP